MRRSAPFRRIIFIILIRYNIKKKGLRYITVDYYNLYTIKDMDKDMDNLEKKDEPAVADKPVTSHTSYKNEKNLKMMEDNIIRRTCHYLYDKFNLKEVQESTMYRHIHDTFIFLICVIVLFNNKLSHLAVIFLIVSMDAFSIVVLHRCPLTDLERKYIKRSSCDDRDELLNSIGVSYDCDHEYEKQVELLINVWLMVAGKCMCIIALKMLNIKLFNFNNIYSN
jgi:hypothetical protein|uniref:Uncharacterized protein n=1 Tax=viral metagenome TaxID=1070528 RepID=A0A6C0EVZ2_9ZZZZ